MVDRSLCCSAYLPVFLLTQPFGNSFIHCAEPSFPVHSDTAFFFYLPFFSFSTLLLLQPAAKQALPVPSIPTGGWKSSLPEIAQIITLQSYFLLSVLLLCAFSYSFPFQSIFVLQSFLWTNERRKNSSLIFYFVLRGTAVRASASVYVGFPELEIRLTDILRGAETGDSAVSWPDVATASGMVREEKETIPILVFSLSKQVSQEILCHVIKNSLHKNN